MDLDRLRRDTPGCVHVLHLDSAGASLMPAPVLKAQQDHLALEARVGGYTAAAKAQSEIQKVYRSLATFLNCQAGEIAIMENATVAWNMAFLSLNLGAGDRILTAEAEYASNYLSFLKLKRDRGIEVAAVPSDASGQLDVSALKEMVDDRVKLIAMTHVPTNGGLINPAAEVGQVARDSGVPFLLDACQSVGQLDLDVEAIGCDFLSASGRKFLRGPRGSGFLYVRQSMLEHIEPPFVDLRGATWIDAETYKARTDAGCFENWEFNYAAVLGLGVAVDYALEVGMPAIEDQALTLAAQLRAMIADVPAAAVYDLGARKGAIVTFTIEGHSAESIAETLGAQDIIVSLSSPASTRLDAMKRDLPTMVRASPHYFNSEVELERFVEVLKGL
ncbi:MAG: aminotransferase class V-fold PLP-dependent enzyme [Pseudomonadota bacterium]